jgi:hypothetical protein
VHAAGVGTQLQAKRGRFLSVRAPRVATQLLGRCGEEVVELLESDGARLQSAASRDVQLPDRLDDPARLLGDRRRLTAGGGAGGEFRVDRVTLAEPLPRMC